MEFFLVSLAGVVASVSGGLLSVLSERLRRRKDQRAETADDRFKRLVRSLSEAAETAKQIEDEVSRRHKLAEKLRADVESYDQLLALKRSEVEAVAQALRIELRKTERRTFWQSVALNAFFFGAGVAVTVVAT